MKIFLGLVLIAVGAVIWQYIELQRFAVRRYTVPAAQVRGRFRLVVLADLHCHEFGRGNARLLRRIAAEEPDFILTAGDMVTAKQTKHYKDVSDFMGRLLEIAPVYYGMGNHESRVKTPESAYYEEYLQYEQRLKEAGVRILDNEKAVLMTKAGDVILLYGLSIPCGCYEKRHPEKLEEGFLKDRFGAGDPQKFQILLAHNPVYSRQYAEWGSNLTFCGHNHGGLVRIPGVGSIFSPQLEWFPEFDRGHYRLPGKNGEGENHVIVSGGLGTHTFHIRIFNRAELVVVDVCP